MILLAIPFDEPPDEAEATALPASDRRVQRVENGTIPRLVDASGTEVLRYSIDAFNAWSQTHWARVFSERPSLGEIREVDFDSFRQFDPDAALSPSGEEVAFSVSDYAAATTLSFVAFLDVEAARFCWWGAQTGGSIDTLRWSPTGRFVAHRLHTARAHGDALSVDRIAPPGKRKTLTGRDVLAVIEGAGAARPSSFQPTFDDLTWTREGRLSFTSRRPSGARARWRTEAEGWPLTPTA